jgi:hypothetical protein
MNDILARHYGYQGVTSGRLRKVKLRNDDPRGGGMDDMAEIQRIMKQSAAKGYPLRDLLKGLVRSRIFVEP